MWVMVLATEAARASVSYGFANLRLKQIIGLVMPENVASVRVLEKIGLRRTGAVTFWEHDFLKYTIDTESEPAGQSSLPPKDE
jgi:RimJ/RimL family protein N-acetyltransferase